MNLARDAAVSPAARVNPTTGPRGDEAFAKARTTTSRSSCRSDTHAIGATMEHESFENDAIATVLNEPRRDQVDREERPDVDRVYMTCAIPDRWLADGVWLTLELKPSMAAPISAVIEVGPSDSSTSCRRSRASGRRSEQGRQSAEALTARLRSMEQSAPSPEPPGVAAPEDGPAVPRRVRSAQRRLRDAPKFPPVGAALPPARACGPARRNRWRWCCDAARDGAGRARPRRRRLPSLLGGRRLARAAFREDALRPGADRRRWSRRHRSPAIRSTEVAEDTLRP